MKDITLKFSESSLSSRNTIKVEHIINRRGVEELLIQIRSQIPHKDFIDLLNSLSFILKVVFIFSLISSDFFA